MQQIIVYVIYGILALIVLGLLVMIIGVTMKNKDAVAAEAAQKEKQKQEAQAAEAVAPRGFYRNEDEEVDLIAHVAKGNRRMPPPPPVNRGPVAIPNTVTNDVKPAKRPGAFFDDLTEDDFKL